MTRAAQDQRLAKAVTMRASGARGKELAKAFGGTSNNLLNQTNAVMDADIAYCAAHCPQELDAARTAYWPRVKG